VFIEAKDDGSGGDNWSYKMRKAPVKSSPTNQHPAFYRPDALPVAKPTLKGNVNVTIPLHIIITSKFSVQLVNHGLPGKITLKQCMFVGLLASEG